MRVCDEDSAQRVKRHRAQRADKGYLTLEIPRQLGAVSVGVSMSGTAWKKQLTKFAPAFLQAAQLILEPALCPSSHGSLLALDATHFLAFALFQALVSS